MEKDFAEWPTLLRKKRASAVILSDYRSFLHIFHRQTSIILTFLGRNYWPTMTRNMYAAIPFSKIK